MIRIGYVRVSREDQNAENQIRILLDEGFSREYIYVDHISGISSMQEREGFSRMSLKSPAWDGRFLIR